MLYKNPTYYLRKSQIKLGTISPLRIQLAGLAGISAGKPLPS